MFAFLFARGDMKSLQVIKLILPIFLCLHACSGDDESNRVMIGQSPSVVVAYVANQASNDVSAFTINGTTGALVPVSGSPYPVGTTPGGIAISSNGTFAYVANQGSNTVSAFTIDAATGTLTAVGGSPFAAGTTPFRVTVSRRQPAPRPTDRLREVPRLPAKPMRVSVPDPSGYIDR